MPQWHDVSDGDFNHDNDTNVISMSSTGMIKTLKSDDNKNTDDDSWRDHRDMTLTMKMTTKCWWQDDKNNDNSSDNDTTIITLTDKQQLTVWTTKTSCSWQQTLGESEATVKPQPCIQATSTEHHLQLCLTAAGSRRRCRCISWLCSIHSHWRYTDHSTQCHLITVARLQMPSLLTKNLFTDFQYPLVSNKFSNFFMLNTPRHTHTGRSANKANSAFHPHGVDKWVVSFISWCYNCSFSRGAAWRTTGKCRCGVIGR